MFFLILRENYEDSEQYKKAYSRDNDSSRNNSTVVDKSSIGNSGNSGGGGYVQKFDFVFLYNMLLFFLSVPTSVYLVTLWDLSKLFVILGLKMCICYQTQTQRKLIFKNKSFIIDTLNFTLDYRVFIE